MLKALTALPVFNEARHVNDVLDQVVRYSQDVLVVDDGSTDSTPELLAVRNDVVTVRHERNRGYGAALATAFDYARRYRYDVIVTIDCDGQHEPQRIPALIAAAENADIVSGSRYLKRFPGQSLPPAERRNINMQVTAELNRRLGYHLTDAFCGFKAYRVDQLKHLKTTEAGYAMPLELWVQAAQAGLKVVEVPVPLIYLEEKRSFGGALDDGMTRLEYYHLVIDRTMAKVEQATGTNGAGALLSATSGLRAIAETLGDSLHGDCSN